MKRVLLTWNSGGSWILPNVVESHKDAAHRWGVQYVSLEKFTASPFADKAELLAKFTDGDHVMWIDGDAIIRFDCPNLFDCVEPDCFAGVPNYQEDTHDGDPWRYHETDWAYYCDRFKRMDLFYSPDRYINGGVFLYSPKVHRPIWFDTYPTQANAEQTLMNFRADMLEMKRHSLPYTFNRIGVEAWKPGPMGYFIQHLASFKFDAAWRKRENRDAVLRSIDWTCRAEALAECTAH